MSVVDAGKNGFGTSDACSDTNSQLVLGGGVALKPHRIDASLGSVVAIKLERRGLLANHARDFCPVHNIDWRLNGLVYISARDLGELIVAACAVTVTLSHGNPPLSRGIPDEGAASDGERDISRAVGESRSVVTGISRVELVPPQTGLVGGNEGTGNSKKPPTGRAAAKHGNGVSMMGRDQGTTAIAARRKK